MKFWAEISMENAAFDETPASELARILREIASQIEQGATDCTTWDANGNRCGAWLISGKREAL